jgi:hypothetical protein
MRKLPLVSVLALASAFASAGTITNGSTTVGLGQHGTLFDGSPYIGMRRNSDGFDPIAPGSPRDSWSVFAGNNAYYSDPYGFGDQGIVSSNTSYGPGSAAVSTIMFQGSYVSMVQHMFFVADNVLRIDGTIQNFGAASDFKVRRNVDWDIDPTAFYEQIDVPVPGGNIAETSYYGFEDPSVPFQYGLGSGVFGPGDLGAGITLDLGNVGTGQQKEYSFFYALSKPGQTPSGLRSQLASLGANYSIIGSSADLSNSAALGVQSVPEPASMAALAIGALGILKRRKKA